jgi:hypothetical protein
MTKMKSVVLANLESRFGKSRALKGSKSLYQFADDKLFVYFRYSRFHKGKTLFYGLRSEDLRLLEGRCSVICFLWDGQMEPTFLPFNEYEEIFRSAKPARDGQFKVHLRLGDDGIDLSLPKVGRFSLDPYVGWEPLERIVDSEATTDVPEMSHSQIQYWLGAIGSAKNYDVWIPLADRSRVKSLGRPLAPLIKTFPVSFEPVRDILPQVDVLWLERGSSRLSALFEVEHSTTIYSGLLRLNDVRLVVPNMEPTFSIVADDERRSTFLRHLNRPTFAAQRP